MGDSRTDAAAAAAGDSPQLPDSSDEQQPTSTSPSTQQPPAGVTEVAPATSSSSVDKDEGEDDTVCEASDSPNFPQDAFVWAKLTRRGAFMPARVARMSDVVPKTPTPPENFVWTYFYDSDSFVWVNKDFMLEFDDQNEEIMSQSVKSKTFKSAVEALGRERASEMKDNAIINFKIKTVAHSKRKHHQEKAAADTSNGDSQPENEFVPKYRAGDIVWAKLPGYPHWPGRVEEPKNAREKKKIPVGSYLIFFYGTHETAIMREHELFAWDQANRGKWESCDSSPEFVASMREVDEEPDAMRDTLPSHVKPKSAGGVSSSGGKSSSRPSSRADSYDASHIVDDEDDDEDFTMSADRVLEMLDKQLDHVSSTIAQPKFGTPPRSGRGGGGAGAGSSHRKRPVSKAASDHDHPSKCKKAALVCNEFSNEGLPLQVHQSSSSSSSSAGAPPDAPTQSSSSSGGGSHPPPPPAPPKRAADVAQIKPFRKNVQPLDKTLGFIGVGQIGRGLVELMLNNNYSVCVWNKTASAACEDAKKLGARVCISAGDVVQQCDIVFCCVSNCSSAREVLTGVNGALAEIKKGKSFINLTTCEPKASIEFYQLIAMRGGRYLETPLIGSVNDSSDGAFLLLAAGDYQLFEEVLPCLELFSRKRTYVGNVGKACELQVIMNMMCGNFTAVVAEGMALCRKSGVDKQQLFSVFQSSDLASPFLVEKAQMMIGNDGYQPAQKPLKHQQSDLRMAIGLSDQLMQALPVTAACNELFKRALSWGDEDLDMSVVYKAATL